MKSYQLFNKYIVLSLLILLNITIVKGQSIAVLSVDSIVKKALRTFKVPGIAVSIIQDDQVFLNKGYGYRSLEPQKRVDENTLFGIASNSKAFTAAALAILVDQGRLKWDDKLIKYIPEFRMYDPYVTKEFTITDLLTHRSGLGLGAGDLLHNPDSTNFTINDVIYSLRNFKPEASFRSKFAYDNIFYLVAAELVRRISGHDWTDFVKEQIFLPLHMDRSGTSYLRVKRDSNLIEGYDELGGKLVKITRSSSEQDSGAGGIYSSANDMSKWMLMQLNEGRYGSKQELQLFSSKIHEDMWTPQIFLPSGKNDGYESHFGAYGLGWFLNDAKGYKLVTHTGQDDGMISEVLLIPELHDGVTVMSNKDGGAAVRAIIDQLSDYFLKVKGRDRIHYWKARVDANSHQSDTVSQLLTTKILHSRISSYDILKLTGRYKDNWFGAVSIYHQNDKLYFRSKKSLQLHGEIFPYNSNTYFIKWADRNLQADAFMIFKPKDKSFTMKRALPETSFAYDFQDLHFIKLK